MCHPGLYFTAGGVSLYSGTEKNMRAVLHSRPSEPLQRESPDQRLLEGKECGIPGSTSRRAEGAFTAGGVSLYGGRSEPLQRAECGLSRCRE